MIKKFEVFLIIGFLIFSCWLMDKSFGYRSLNGQFRIARHQVGDFGLHLSLIRSFSWGNNWPPESPFFPGRPLPYHYYFDFLVGLLEKIGLRIDLAFNGLSLLALTALLFLIYKLSQIIFGQNIILGLLSVILFIFHSSLTFLDFFKNKTLGLSLLKDLWFLPDYLNQGPFDDSIISIFFTLNVFLNQRHLIAGLAISLFIFYFVLSQLVNSQEISKKSLLLLGLLLGISSRIHTLIFFSTGLVLFFLFLFFKRLRSFLFLISPALILASFHLNQVLNQDLSHPLFNPGFLAEKPLTLLSFGKFWYLNLGAALFLIPAGFLLAKPQQKKIFFSFLPLFILANLFQFGFRIDHNHSLFNLFLIVTNFYIAYFLIWLFNKKILGKIFFFTLIFLLTISGLIDLMAVKNDFQLRVDDAPTNQLMAWIKKETEKEAVFLAREEILDPVTLSGRKNYLGAHYYSEVMGYDYFGRKTLAKKFFEAQDKKTLVTIKEEGIDYLIIPLKEISDFHYQVNLEFLKESLAISYQDEEVSVFKL